MFILIFLYRTIGIGMASIAARFGGMVSPFARNLVGEQRFPMLFKSC